MSETSFNPSFVESMMIRLIHHREVFLEVLGLIDQTNFIIPTEHHFMVLWAAMQHVNQQHGQLPYYALRDTIQLMAANMPHFSPAHLDYLIRETPDRPGLLLVAWSTQASMLLVEDTRSMVKAWLRERRIWNPRSRGLVSRHSALQPGQIEDLLSNAVQARDQLHRIDINPVVSAWPEQFKDDHVIVETTGLQWMDDWMDGGDAPGEVNGLLGPTGVGKTTIACNIAVAKAKVERAKSIASGKPPRVVYLMSYEQAGVEIRKRLWCCAGQVKNSEFTFNDFSRLSSEAAQNWKPYEHDLHREMFGENAAQNRMSGEMDRLMAQKPILEHGIRIVDLSGMTPQSLPGNGFVDEMAALISADQQKCGNPGVALVIVDYVLLAAERYMSEKKIDEGKLRHVIRRFVDETRSKVAGKYGCAGWLLHQLNKDGNDGSPTKKTSHTQASEGSAFAAFLTFCASFGTKDELSSCTLLRFTKRRRAGDVRDTQILHIRGEMQVIEDGNENFVIDDHQGRILKRSEAAQIHGGLDSPHPASVNAMLAPRQSTRNEADF